ncbi:DUF4097 family beta strand repeat protein [Candidatus Dependentiae bacterium]|nr:DUF4097 family beta strand repeat protein [Candidatus Dependentiae bacterium]
MVRNTLYGIAGLLICSTSPAVSAHWSNFWQKKTEEHITKDYVIEDTCHITLDTTEGSVLVKPWSEKKVSFEIIKRGTEEELKATSVTSKAEGKEILLTTRVASDNPSAQVDYILMVPEQVSLHITQAKGPVTVKGLSGTLNISLEEGAISIEDAQKTVVAKTGYGDITVKLNKFDETSGAFLETLHGSITLFLPLQARASLQAKTAAGRIISEHPVTLAPVALKLNHQSWERLKKNVEGTLGGLQGGAPLTLETAKGNIVLKES